MVNSTTKTDGAQPYGGAKNGKSAAHAAARIFNPDAERAIIGAMLLDPNEIKNVRAIINSSDIEDRVNRKIADAIFTLDDEGKPGDMVSAAEELRKGGDDSFFPILEMAVGACDAPSRATHYATIVKDLAIAREVHALTQDAGRAIISGA